MATDWKLFVKIRELVENGQTDRFAIARHLDMWSVTHDSHGNASRTLQSSYAQILANLAHLPYAVQDAFRESRMFGGTDRRLLCRDISTLYRVYRNEESSNFDSFYAELLESRTEPRRIVRNATQSTDEQSTVQTPEHGKGRIMTHLERLLGELLKDRRITFDQCTVILASVQFTHDAIRTDTVAYGSLVSEYGTRFKDSIMELQETI